MKKESALSVFFVEMVIIGGMRVYGAERVVKKKFPASMRNLQPATYHHCFLSSCTSVLWLMIIVYYRSGIESSSKGGTPTTPGGGRLCECGAILCGVLLLYLELVFVSVCYNVFCSKRRKVLAQQRFASNSLSPPTSGDGCPSEY